MPMRLSNEQYEFIKGEVVALFEHYMVKCIPISGFELAYKMGITLIAYSSLSESKQKVAMKCSSDGFYVEDKNGADSIYYNDTLSYERMNMTILHEIGHCVLDHKEGSEEEESEASFFAKYAAAPPVLIHKIKPKCAEDISDMFNVSYEAASYALSYYKKWLQYGFSTYTDYEIALLKLFDVA